ERIEQSPIREVAATDTCPPPDPLPEKFKVLPVGPLFAEAIWRIHRGESVSALFR
ncbi:MAG TPA: ribose-phosphate pyrophosphokinase, partial [Oceanithermus sp.]|nr:ribose-phosphate pyrophosphokinase [Oceanithermus sp.]